MTAPFRLVIRTLAEGEPSGFDAAIVQVPDHWYQEVNGERAFLAQVAGRELREKSEFMAAASGERLHHAEWVVTSDPALVTPLGLRHDCAECRAGTDRALALLAEHPGAEVAVGQLWWARCPGA